MTPVITSAASAPFIEGTAGQFQVTSSGNPAANYSVVSGTLPAGLTLDPNSGILSGTPATGSNGSYAFTIQATNEAGSDTQNFTLTDELIPTITSAVSTPFIEGTPGQFQVTSNAFPAATYSVVSGTLPAGLTLDPNSGILSGTPAAGSNGSYAFTVQASNAAGSATQNFTLNDELTPTITSAATAPFIEGSAGRFQVTSSGNPAATYSVVSGALPTGLTLDPTSGTLSGTPAAGSNGSYAFTIQATNAAGSATQNFTLTDELTPSITSAATAPFIEGTAGQFQVTSSGFPSATYTVISGALPAGLTLNSTSGLISGTTTSTGNYSFTIAASNAAGSATQSFALSAEALPAFSGASTLTTQEGQAVSFPVAATGSPAPTYSIVSGSLPSGLSLNATTGLISGRPTVGSNGIYAFTIQATNAAGSATEAVGLTVQSAPKITSGSATTFVESIPTQFQVTASGTPVASYSIASGSLPSGLTLASSGLLSGTAAPGTHGTYTVTIVASNSLGSSRQTLTLTVQSLPAFTSAAGTTFTAGNSGYFQVSATASPTATYSISSGTLPSGVTLNATSGLLSGAPSAASFGNDVFTILATNAAGSTSQTFTLSVQIKPTITSATAATSPMGLRANSR